MASFTEIVSDHFNNILGTIAGTTVFWKLTDRFFDWLKQRSADQIREVTKEDFGSINKRLDKMEHDRQQENLELKQLILHKMK